MFRESLSKSRESTVAVDSKKDDKGRTGTLDYWRLARTAAFHAVGLIPTQSEAKIQLEHIVSLDKTQTEVNEHTKRVQDILQKTTQSVINSLYQPIGLDKKNELAWYNYSPQGIVARILTYCVVNKINIGLDHIAAMAADPQEYLLLKTPGLWGSFSTFMSRESGPRQTVKTLPSPLLHTIEPLINKALSHEAKQKNVANIHDLLFKTIEMRKQNILGCIPSSLCSATTIFQSVYLLERSTFH